MSLQWTGDEIDAALSFAELFKQQFEARQQEILDALNSGWDGKYDMSGEQLYYFDYGGKTPAELYGEPTYEPNVNWSAYQEMTEQNPDQAAAIKEALVGGGEVGDQIVVAGQVWTVMQVDDYVWW